MTTDANATKPETIEVDLYGSKLSLPKDVADKMIAARDAEKQSRPETAEKLGKIEAEKNTAEAARMRAEEDKQLVELASKKQLDEMRSIASKDATDRLQKVANKLRDKHLAAALSGNKNVVSSAVPDVVDQLRTRIAYDTESDAIVVLDEAGRPAKDAAGSAIQVDTWLADWLGKRPHYLLDKTHAGNGADPVKSAGSGQVMKRDAFDRLPHKARKEFFAAGGTLVD